MTQLSSLTVSVVIPCRDEEQFIGNCLDAVLANDFPEEQLEILVVDGMSEDATRSIVAEYAIQNPHIRLMDNPKRITPSALNIGIAGARGDVIMRLDAHTMCPPNYIRDLVGWLNKSGADNVGGVWITCPASDSLIARAVATGLSHPFGVGNAYYRIGTSEPRWVDTVPFGCYRRDVFERIGCFDEDLVRNQDDEFNLRLIKEGGRILLVPGIATRYYARESLRKLARMSYQYGYFKPLVARKVGRIMTIRQVVPALFVVGLMTSSVLAPWFVGARLLGGMMLGLYVLTDLFFSARAGLREGLGVGLVLAVTFPVLHFAYGFGFLRGVVDFLVLGRVSATARLSR